MSEKEITAKIEQLVGQKGEWCIGQPPIWTVEFKLGDKQYAISLSETWE